MSEVNEKVDFATYFRNLDETEGVMDSNIFRIFDRGDFYSVYGKNSEVLADSFFHSREFVKTIGSASFPLSVTHISKARFCNVLEHILFSLKCKVQYYTRGKDTSRDSIDWEITKQGNSGDISNFQDILSSIHHAITAFVVIDKPHSTSNKQRVISVVLCDTVQNTVTVSLFYDDSNYACLEACFSQQQPSTCYYYMDKEYCDETSRIHQILSSMQIGSTELKYSELPQIYTSTRPDSSATVNTNSKDSTSTSIDCSTGDDIQHVTNLTKHTIKDTLVSILPIFQHSSQPLIQTYIQSYPSVCIPLSCMYTKLQLDSVQNIYHCKMYDSKAYVQLDATASSTLNLLPAVTDTNKSMSLYGLLNNTKTKMGGRMLQDWILSPLRSIETITQRQDVVEGFMQEYSLVTSIYEQLRMLPDVDYVLRKLNKRIATKQAIKSDHVEYIIQELYHLYNVSKACRELYSIFTSTACAENLSVQSGCKNYITYLSDHLPQFEEYCTLIENTIDIAAIQDHNYIILPSNNTELAEIAKSKDKYYRAMVRVQTEKAEEFKLINRVKLQRANQYGYHFRVSRKDEQNIRGNKSIEILESRKDGVKFTCASLKALASTYEANIREYNELSRDIVYNLVHTTMPTYVPIFTNISSILAEIDVLASFAHISHISYPRYVRPKMIPTTGASNDTNTTTKTDTKTKTKTEDDDESSPSTTTTSSTSLMDRLVIEDGRHPCVEVQANISYIPNSVHLDKSKGYLEIITGPNMGGKSTYLRSIGVICIMAHIGCFVPATSATIPILDSILSRVGAGDSQLLGLSTFMKEMIETNTICSNATQNSLVLIDELGRGTSTYDGFGLAWAICEYLATHTQCYCIFATHFHELCALEKLHEGKIKNRHVTASTQSNSITMLYKLEDGYCDQSYGIHVAELTNFPNQVIADARQKLQILESVGKETAVIGNIANVHVYTDALSEQMKRKLDSLSDTEIDTILQTIMSKKKVKTTGNTEEKEDTTTTNTTQNDHLAKEDIIQCIPQELVQLLK